MLLPFVLLLGLTPAPLTGAELDRIAHGEVLVRSESSLAPDGKTVGYGIGAIAINASPEATWKVLANYHDKAEYQPRVKTVTVLEETAIEVHAAMTVTVAWTSVHYTGYYTLDPAAHTVHWRLDKEAKDNTIKDMDGSYSVIAVADNQTVLYFTTYVDSGLLVPRFIQTFFSTKAIPELLKSIKMRVESGGQYHK